MQLELNRPLARDSAADSDDVRAVKHALNRLGYYTPDPVIGMNDIPEATLFEAIRAFQREQHLNPTGQLRPDDETVTALNIAMEQAGDSGRYVWHTVHDDKVRSSHAARDGKVFAWNDPPPGGHPGTEYNCRCWAQNIKRAEDIDDPPIIPVYPVETVVAAALPVLRIPRILAAVSKYNAGKREIKIERQQLQHEFKHAKIFGVTGNESKKTLRQFEDAIRSHIKNPAVKEIRGTYRKEPAIHYLDKKTAINVSKRTDGNFWIVRKLSAKQMWHMLKDGRIGGGK